MVGVGDGVRTWTYRAAGIGKINRIFTYDKALSGSTQCFSIHTEAGGARIAVTLPTFTILVSLVAILTGRGASCDWGSDGCTGWAALARGEDKELAFRDDTLDGDTEGQSGFTRARNTHISLPRLPFGVVDIVLCAGGHGVVDGGQRRADRTALALEEILQVGLTPHSRTPLHFAGSTIGFCKIQMKNIQ